MKGYGMILMSFLFYSISIAQIPHLDVLCSDSLAGRGYVHDGDKKAVNYIKREFDKYGLGQVQEQNFNVQVNVFPDSIHLYSLEKDNKTRELILGVDYVVAPSSQSINTDFFWIELDNKFYSSKRKIKQFIHSNKTHKDSLFAYVYHANDVSADKVSVEFVKALQEKPFVIELTNKKSMLTVASKQSSQTKVIMNDSVFGTINHGFYAQINSIEKKYITQNVIGIVEGSIKDSFIVVCAHYDHLGMQGQSIYRGANDNATGTAAMLELAKRFGYTKPKLSLVFIAFGAEEIGLKGSSYFVEHPVFPLSKIKYVINLDLLGAGSKGITLVNGVEEQELTNKFISQNKILTQPFPEIKIRKNAANSDHFPFTQKEVSAIFLYSLGSVGGYHHLDDTIEALEIGSFKRFVDLLEAVLKN